MKKLFTLVSAACLCFGISATAQVSEGGKPLSFKNPALSDKNTPIVELGGLNMVAVQAEDNLREQNGDLPFFSRMINVNITNSQHGVWYQLPNGDKVWKVSFHSPGALALNLQFSEYNMPVGGKMFVYNADRSEVFGAFTAANNKSWGGMAIGNVLGDQVIVEYHEPASVSGQGAFTFSAIGHAYRQIERATGNLRGSDPCEVDVNCSPEGSNWQDEKKGACRILVASSGGQGWCSGSLVNNTSWDCKNYVLTAMHCGDPIAQQQFGNYIFYFNYESSGCGSGAAPTNQSITGCSERANSNDGGGGSGSDFLLVELTGSIPSGYGVYYNGWSASNTASTSGVSIHHPAGDRKKISTYTSTLGSTTWGGTPNTHWLVDWVGTTNGHGVTEGGSSGSPIFNNNGEIVGQLTGGASFCTQVPNTAEDRYGKMSYNWTSNPGDDLKDFLDPTNTGALSVAGTYAPCASPQPDDAGITTVLAPSGTVCGVTVSPEVTLRNYGNNTLTSVTITYDIDGGTGVPYSWTGSLASGSSVNVILPSSATTPGPHTINVATSNPNGNTDTNTGNDGTNDSFTANTSGSQVTIAITTDCWGSETSWTLFDSGNNTVATGGPYQDGTPLQVESTTLCLPDGCYSLQVDDAYGDGMFGSQWTTCSDDGNAQVLDAGNNVMVELDDPDFGTDTTLTFCVTSTLAAFFTTNNTTICAGSAITFTDQSSGNPTSWNWTFGGGTPGTSTSQNPQITFNTPGTFDVSLTVDDGNTNDTNTQTNYITVVPSPTGTATGTPETCDGDCDGSLSGTATGGTSPYTYTWTGGLGNGQTINNVCAGSYNLVITDANNCTASGISATVAAGAAAPTASFTASATTVFLDQGGVVNFTDNSAGATAWSWSFGDGGTDTNQNPSHTYTSAGTYTVTLTVTNANGCSDIFTMTITVTESNAIGENALAEALNVFPNPNDGRFNLEVDVQGYNYLKVEVYNAIGDLVEVIENPAMDNQLTVDLRTHGVGMYIVRVTVDDVFASRRVSVLR